MRWVEVLFFLIPLAVSLDVGCDGETDTLVVHKKIPSFAGFCKKVDGEVKFIPKYCKYPEINITISKPGETVYGGHPDFGFSYACLFKDSSNYGVTITGCVIDGKQIKEGELHRDKNGALFTCIKENNSWSFKQVTEPKTGDCKEGQEKMEGSAAYTCKDGKYAISACLLHLSNSTDVKVAFNSSIDVAARYRYFCSASVNSDGIRVAIYPIACTDNENNLIEIGQEKKQNDGTIASCVKGSNNAILRLVRTPVTVVSDSVITINSVSYKQEKNGKVAIGCDPFGNGTLLKNGDKAVIYNIEYLCKQEGEKIELAAQCCISSEGKPMKVGDENTLSDGAKETCSIDGVTERIVYRVGSKHGCRLSDGRYVAKNEFYVERRELSVDGKTLKYFTNYQCAGTSAISYLVPIGCDVGQEGSFGHGEMVTIGKETYSCVVQNTGVLYLEHIESDKASCTVAGTQYLHGQEVPDSSNSTIYRCDKGQLVKIGCWARGKRFNVGELFYCADEPFVCKQEGTGAIALGIAGCYADGKLFHFRHSVRFEDGSYTCSYIELFPEIFAANWDPNGCYYNGNSFLHYTGYTKDGSRWIYCGYNAKTRQTFIRELSAEESECAIKSDKVAPGMINTECIAIINRDTTGTGTGISEGVIIVEGPNGGSGSGNEHSGSDNDSSGNSAGNDGKTKKPTGPGGEDSNGSTDGPDGPVGPDGKTKKPSGPGGEDSDGSTDGPDGPVGPDGKTKKPSGPGGDSHESNEEPEGTDVSVRTKSPGGNRRTRRPHGPGKGGRTRKPSGPNGENSDESSEENPIGRTRGPGARWPHEDRTRGPKVPGNKGKKPRGPHGHHGHHYPGHQDHTHGFHCRRYKNDQLCQEVCTMLAPHCLGSMIEGLIRDLPEEFKQYSDAIRLLEFIGDGGDVAGQVFNVSGLITTIKKDIEAHKCPGNIGIVTKTPEVQHESTTAVPSEGLTSRPIDSPNHRLNCPHFRRHLLERLYKIINTSKKRLPQLTAECSKNLESCIFGDATACESFRSSKCIAKDACVERANCEKCDKANDASVNMKVLVKYMCSGTCELTKPQIGEIELQIEESADKLGQFHLQCQTSQTRQRRRSVIVF